MPDGANIAFTVPASCSEIVFTYDAATHVLTIGAEGAPRGNLARARAHWCRADTVAWNPGAVRRRLERPPRTTRADGGLTLGTDGVRAASPFR